MVDPFMCERILEVSRILLKDLVEHDYSHIQHLVVVDLIRQDTGWDLSSLDNIVTQDLQRRIQVISIGFQCPQSDKLVWLVEKTGNVSIKNVCRFLCEEKIVEIIKILVRIIFHCSPHVKHFFMVDGAQKVS